MNLTTGQCRSLSSGMPFSAAIDWAICSFHCSGFVMKPSASTSTGASAIRVVVISSSLLGVNGEVFLAGGRHCRPDAWDLAAGQERVPVNPLERELAEVVEPRFAQEWQPERSREVTGQRLG